MTSDDLETVEFAEKVILKTLGRAGSASRPSPIFILGAPRTGSTLLYQALCSRFALPYIANLTNDRFARTPIVGLAIQKSVPRAIDFRSRYGKTDGPFQPSEASAVMSHWFGGGHPSQLVSSSIRDGAETHFKMTLAGAEAMFKAPLLMKNPWNCFRIRYLARALPKARFIWIRRDIAESAKSDLSARYATKGSPQIWNSATPANVDSLRTLPPTAQVVENQHEFSRAIAEALKESAGNRWAEAWYEDFCADPDGQVARLGAFLNLAPSPTTAPINVVHEKRRDLEVDDVDAIDSYLMEHAERLASHRYSTHAAQ